MYQDRGCQCGNNYIVNKKYWLCELCNYKRLHDGKTPYEVRMDKFKSKSGEDKGKVNKLPYKKRKPLKSSKKRVEKRLKTLEKDRELYLYQFNTKPHFCEECGKPLPNVFEDKYKIIAIWQYSHIIPKSLRPELRHHKLNINRLCLDDHTKWEHAGKEEKKLMKIYKPNQENIKIMLKEIGQWFSD